MRDIKKCKKFDAAKTKKREEAEELKSIKYKR